MTARKYDTDQVPSDAHDRVLTLWPLTAGYRKAGRAWYPNAGRFATRLAAERNTPRNLVAGALAVLSPMIDWEDAKLDTISLILGSGAGLMAFPANIEKAQQILSGELDPNLDLKGKKVKRFYDNILRPKTSQVVTLDTHMARILGYPPGDVFQAAGLYEAIEDGFVTASRTLSIQPSTVQATLWLTFKGKRQPPTQEKE